MCYTSGTTGMPKGVVYSHRSTYLHAMGACLGNAFAVSDRDRILPVVPMFHANAWGLAYAAVLSGADLIMPDRFLQPEPLVRLIEAERPTIAGAVPTIWNGLLQHIRAHGGDVSSLRLVPCGGSAVPHALMEAFQKELGVEILQAWGMTETSPLASVARPPRGVSGDEAWALPGHRGQAVLHRRRAAGRRQWRVLPNDGVAVGEVQVRGPWITGSYYKDDDPGKFHDGWLRTGDVGTIDRLGYITLTDRAKDVIKSGGEWISSMELENILMGHPEVAEAAVIGVPDEKWGERPLATVVIKGRGHDHAEGAQGVPGRPDTPLAAPGALVGHRGGTEDQRREVREDPDPGGVRGRRLRGGRGAVTGSAPPAPGPAARSPAGRARLFRDAVRQLLWHVWRHPGTLMRTAWSSGGFA